MYHVPCILYVAFLFGAQHVYRHIFADRKYVEVYCADDAKSEIGLDREDFIALVCLYI